MQPHADSTTEAAADHLLVRPPDAPPGPLFRKLILGETFALGALASEARVGAVGIKGLAHQVGRLFLGRSIRCWKCADGRTRAHHRRCPCRGRGGRSRRHSFRVGGRPAHTPFG